MKGFMLRGGAVAALALLVAPFASSPALALPSFARGQGTPCASCHASPAGQLGQREMLTTVENETAPSVATVDLLPTVKQQALSARLSLHTTVDNSAPEQERSRPQERMSLALPSRPTARLALTGMSGQVKINSVDASIGFFGDGEGRPLLSSTADPRFWYRLGYSPRFGSLGLAVGLFGETASRSIIDREQGSAFARTVGLDARISGQIADYSFDLSGMYMTSRESEAMDGGALNDWQQASGLYASAELGLSRSVTLTAAYRSIPVGATTGTDTASEDEQLATFGARLSLSNETSLASWYTSYLSERSSDYSADGAFTLLFISNF